MAKKYRRNIVQRRYRSRKRAYEIYKKREKERDLEPKSFSEWNTPYRQRKFLRREFNLYKKKYEERVSKSIYGFREDEYDNYRPEEKIINFDIFVDAYYRTRNDLLEEVKEGERKNVGSVINEIINNQAYELSSKKARAISKYLLSEERDLLKEKKIIYLAKDENGKIVEKVKTKRLELLIRQGGFVRKEVGLWDMIRDDYKDYKAMGVDSTEIKKIIGQTYFDSK